MNWYAGLEEICQPDAPLAGHTWYGLGGPARWLVTPRDEAELAEVLRRCADQGVPWRVLGRGANVLVGDRGFDGAVIRLSEPAWEAMHFMPPRVRAAAGVDFPRLVRNTIERGLVGLEDLAGIPGTVGGATRMNAGGRHGEVARYVHSARLVRPDGSIVERVAAELEFGYRRSRLDGAVIAEVTFELQPGDTTAAMQRFRAIWSEKYATQPALSSKCAGCVFKNPPGDAAGRLLDYQGLKGARRGAAEISPKHANFIVAHPGATAQNVIDLIAHARERVHSATGVQLELEIEIW